MASRIKFIVAVGLIITSCSRKENSPIESDISGAYARQYSFKVIDPETGNEIGIRTIRDTIFIKPNGNKYEVSNNKWKMNDFDKDGWQSMEHAEDRPLPRYDALFENNKLSCVQPGLIPPLYLNPAKMVVFKDSKTIYEKVQQIR